MYFIRGTRVSQPPHCACATCLTEAVENRKRPTMTLSSSRRCRIFPQIVKLALSIFSPLSLSQISQPWTSEYHVGEAPPPRCRPIPPPCIAAIFPPPKDDFRLSPSQSPRPPSSSHERARPAGGGITVSELWLLTLRGAADAAGSGEMGC
jgi:hypothetical protein